MHGSRRPRLINCLLPTGRHDLPCPPPKKEPPTCDPAAHLFHATLTCLFIFKVDKGIADVVLGHWVYGQVKEVEWPWLWGPFDRQAPAFQIVSNHTLKDHKDYNMTLHNSVIYIYVYYRILYIEWIDHQFWKTTTHLNNLLRANSEWPAIAQAL